MNMGNGKEMDAITWMECNSLTFRPNPFFHICLNLSSPIRESWLGQMTHRGNLFSGLSLSSYNFSLSLSSLSPRPLRFHVRGHHSFYFTLFLFLPFFFLSFFFLLQKPTNWYSYTSFEFQFSLSLPLGVQFRFLFFLPRVFACMPCTLVLLLISLFCV